jgi:hypothetical protein
MSQVSYRYKTRDIDDCFQEVLEDLYSTQHELFPTHILTVQMIRERYQVFRTYRKSSDSRALAMGVSPNDVDVVKRWQAVEAAKGTRTSGALNAPVLCGGKFIDAIVSTIHRRNVTSEWRRPSDVGKTIR